MLRSTKQLPPPADVGMEVFLFPDDESNVKRLGTVSGVCAEGLVITWAGGNEQAIVAHDWWQDGAFMPLDVVQRPAACELCGVELDLQRCQDLRSGTCGEDCAACRALSLLATGCAWDAWESFRFAMHTLSQRLAGEELHAAKLRHRASLLTASLLMNLLQQPIALTTSEVQEAGELDVSSGAVFAWTWKRFVIGKVEDVEPRSQELLQMSLAIARLKRRFGDGYEQDVARKDAEEGSVWCEFVCKNKSIASCQRGFAAVRKNLAAGKLTEERARAILAAKEDQLSHLQSELQAFECSHDFLAVRGILEGYARWYHGSGIAAVMERQKQLQRPMPSVNGSLLESAAVLWLRESNGVGLPHVPEGLSRRVLTNVSFAGIQLPTFAAAEFDAFVVLCRASDRGWEVQRLERWVEVKANPDEVLPALCRHADALEALASINSHVSMAHSDEESGWFHFSSKVFAEFHGHFTFVTTPGGDSVVSHGSYVPRSLLCPRSVASLLFDFALNRLTAAEALDPECPAGSFDYVEELYRRSGEVLMRERTDEGGAASYEGYLTNASARLRELVAMGNVFIFDDPFRTCYQAPGLCPAQGGCNDELTLSLRTYAAHASAHLSQE